MIPGGLALTLAKGAEGPCPRPTGTLHLFCVGRHYHEAQNYERLFTGSWLRRTRHQTQRCFWRRSSEALGLGDPGRLPWQVGLGTATAIWQGAGLAARPVKARWVWLPGRWLMPRCRQARRYPSAMPRTPQHVEARWTEVGGPVMPGPPQPAQAPSSGGRRSQGCGRLRLTAQAAGTPTAGTAALRTMKKAGERSPYSESSQTARIGQHERRAVLLDSTPTVRPPTDGMRNAAQWIE